ncbi:MAG: TIGR03621 family F420-dependent LLM class oxidoreductase [Acidimicrobiaceae bacterium]|nr:TIGR03621 family F420-dependent LLM class oxidoreductase [Acidimicrobiaceae bacterium]
MTHPFRFGVLLRSPLPDLTWTDTAKKLEDLGFSALNIPDHFGDQWSVTPALAATAATTTKLRLGPLVLCNDYRHPLILAQEMATIDVISEGRLELGLGAGWMRSDYDASGIEYDSPGTRIERLEEAVQVVYGLFSSDYFSFSGKYYRIGEHYGRPDPVQTRVPLLIGGGGPKMLGLAARYADIVGVNANLRSGKIDENTLDDLTESRFDEKLTWVRDAAGDRFEQIELHVLTQIAQVTAGGQATKDTLNATASFVGRPPEIAEKSPMLLIGSAEEMADTLRERRERWGFNYISIPGSSDIEAFSAVINLLDGE